MAERPQLFFVRSCFWSNTNLQKYQLLSVIELLVKCVLKEQKQVRKKYEVVSSLVLNGHSFHWELWLMRESISSIVTIYSGLFLKSWTPDSVMQRTLILHFTKAKLQSQVVYVPILLKISGSHIVLYFTFSLLRHHGHFPMLLISLWKCLNRFEIFFHLHYHDVCKPSTIFGCTVLFSPAFHRYKSRCSKHPCLYASILITSLIMFLG